MSHVEKHFSDDTSIALFIIGGNLLTTSFALAFSIVFALHESNFRNDLSLCRTGFVLMYDEIDEWSCDLM